MPTPQQPQPPTLVNDDARRSDSLTVTWPDATEAQTYNSRITDEAGNTTIQSNVSRPLSFGGLTPTKKYTIAIQSRNVDAMGIPHVSAYSANLVTRTRPETPGAPTIIQDAVTPIFLVKWHLAGPAGGNAELRQIGNASDQIVLANGPLTGEKVFSSIPSGLSWQYLLRVTLPQADMPSGINESLWSVASAITTVEAISSSPALRQTFGNIRLPGRF